MLSANVFMPSKKRRLCQKDADLQTPKSKRHLNARHRFSPMNPKAFDVWWGEGEKPLVSCTALTTSAPKELSWLHERAPVVLDYDHYDLWLDRSTPDIADLSELLRPYPAAELEVYPVSTKVNRAGIDEPALLVSVSDIQA